MHQQINLATRDGIRSAELFTTFHCKIAGERYTFAIHRHLSCNTHVKVSELKTGMGIAEILFADLVESETPSFVVADLVSQGKQALAELIDTRGEQTVAQVLMDNRHLAQVLNDRAVVH
ncbi:hypothetical protein H8F21_13630 [Pseudomonas sp. P66]|uniref:Uncharacterized protein n=1 Tax=Pseudomonas arcuscaelestis TaxID=2710591 RepID=A0ABS2BYP9_9PSED|nr:hypothetical protein [Pseudomonas arcuscaelestis]MBM5458605.1 hypothetical protein [Pseudomonas arcuscaelestis]